jgi:hypothetical protein
MIYLLPVPNGHLHHNVVNGHKNARVGFGSIINRLPGWDLVNQDYGSADTDHPNELFTDLQHCCKLSVFLYCSLFRQALRIDSPYHLPQ